MKNEGFICLWRKTQYDPIWFNSTPEQKAIFITLLFMANWKEQKYDIFGDEITFVYTNSGIDRKRCINAERKNSN